MGVEYDDVTCIHQYGWESNMRYIVMFDCHLYWCVHVTSSGSTPIRIDVYSLHRHVRLPPVLMCTRYIVMFDSHPYWCVHVTSSGSTSICLDMYMLQRHIRLPSVLMCTRYIVMFDSYPFDVYTLYRHVRLPSLLMCTCYIVMFDSHPFDWMGVEYDDVTCTHQYWWESNMTM
jgi:hypothetical protein